MSSISAVVRDETGRAGLVLSVNVDRTVFDDAVGSFVRGRGTTVERLSKEQRLILLAQLDASGTFGQRHSAPAVARALRISRATVYQLLAKIRQDPRTGIDAP